MKKYIYFVFFLVISLIFAVCSGDTDNSNNEPPLVIKTGKVTFFNESSYKIVIHQDAFSGPVLLELSAGGSKKVDVRTSDNYGSGSTFSIEYLLRIQLVESTGGEIREASISAIDPNVQINRVIEENKSYTIQIPQPQNLEARSAFVCITNKYNLPFELKYLGTVFKQTDNGNISVPAYKTGIYKLPLGTEGIIPSNGRLYKNYQVVSTFSSVEVPEFTAQNGIKYNFEYDGTTVRKSEKFEDTLIFR